MSERDDFEKWEKSGNWDLTRHGDGYDKGSTSCVWQAWQAAIQHCKQGEPSDEVYALRAKNAYLLAQLANNSIPPQPPCDNDHVADGCEKFAHAMPKSEEPVMWRRSLKHGREVRYSPPTEQTRGTGWTPLYTTPQPSTDVSELDWQPIETAPIDGTKVLGWNIEYGQRETFMREYGKGSPGYALYEKGKGPLQCGWEWYEPQSGWIATWKPTHWKILPSSPSTP